MEKSILDYIYGSGYVLDERTPDPRDWIESVSNNDTMVCLAITFTTTIKTSVKLAVNLKITEGESFPTIPLISQGKKVNKLPPHSQYTWFKQKIKEIFGNYNYWFVLDWQKNRDKLVHVHGISYCPRHILDMYMVSVRQRAEVLLQAKQHDIREVYELQNWIDYIKVKTSFPPITMN